ncbi:MAG: flippase-like domain-containing protein [Candidatus Sumerlaeia bacterium]|nr:flippase-like domain-containing protein [Candidatus Sumerlaeia bacterium]
MGKKRLLAITISLLLLAALFASIDLGELGRVLGQVSLFWLSIGMVLFVPQILLIAFRWRYLCRPLADIPLAECVRQVLAASSLNLILPSKLGDLAKGVFLYRRGGCRFSEGMHVVVFEKLMDIFALSLWMVLGWLLFPSAEWWVLGMLIFGIGLLYLISSIYFRPKGMLRRMLPGRLSEIAKFGPRVTKLTRVQGGRRRGILLQSIALWFLHLLQIHIFLIAVGVQLGLIEVLARMPIPLFAGLLPLTMAGFGTRDWAIVAVFASQINPPEVLVAAALLVSLRYVVPALCGLAFLPTYLSLGRDALRRRGNLASQNISPDERESV